ncbi:MAG TPA: cupin domain-containing protein [Steroidobacteraceae bacterium]|nr:cupin domain-containing protein [Steroidobacteraceae bacterium]
MRTLPLLAYWPLALLGLVVAPMASGAEPTAAASSAPPTYTYATNGIKDHIPGGGGSEWKLLLNESNLGGKEMEMVEVSLAAGTTVGSHTHGSLEVIYVLSGTYDHEVNGKRYELTAGMVGIVRPGDHVRHLVPKSGPAKLLIIWVPGGEAAKVLRQPKGVDVAPLSPQP